MAQQNAMVEKKKAEFDGEEVPGLVSVDEITLTRATIPVPSFDRIRQIQSNVTEIPALKLKYKLERNTITEQFFNDWWENNEIKSGVIIRTDAHGSEFKRTLIPDCEITEKTEPAYDASAPEYASITVTLLPWDYITVK